MKFSLPLTLGLLLALLLVAAIAVYTTKSDVLPAEIWVFRTPHPERVSISPGGAEVEHGSVAWSDAGVSLWYEPSFMQRLLWKVGLGDPVDGTSYAHSGRKQDEADGTWHHYVRVPD